VDVESFLKNTMSSEVGLNGILAYMLERQIKLARKHFIITNFSHFVGGFGLALLLQYYLSGNAFLPVMVGWILVAFTLIVHIYVLQS
jgi:hypothetical protein